MKITDVRIELANNGEEKLLAFACVTLDNCFLIRDIRIIQSSHRRFVAMPARKLGRPCPHCRVRNALLAHYCNHCGKPLPPQSARINSDGRQKYFEDIVHPTNAQTRQMLEEAVLHAYERELAHARQSASALQPALQVSGGA